MTLKSYPIPVVEAATGIPRRIIYSRANGLGISAAGGITLTQIFQILAVTPRPRESATAAPEDVAELRYILEASGALGGNPDQISMFDES